MLILRLLFVLGLFYSLGMSVMSGVSGYRFLRQNEPWAATGSLLFCIQSWVAIVALILLLKWGVV